MTSMSLPVGISTSRRKTIGLFLNAVESLNAPLKGRSSTRLYYAAAKKRKHRSFFAISHIVNWLPPVSYVS